MNNELKIKSLKGLRFGNSKIQYERKGFALYHPDLGFLSFGEKDKYGFYKIYSPEGGRKVLEKIISEGGLTDYNNIVWVKPISKIA